MKKILYLLFFISFLFVAGCTEESRNKIFRQADNILGKDLLVTYIDNGKTVKTWIVRDGKITAGKDDTGRVLGYYFFWSETGYVQLPIERTIIEEYREGGN
ncbi:MAG: hypothetical protein HQM13_18940 [SAR324 cluster bacterium]|nr:hypothetical protein [SAR324 cluster bacterium]